MAQVEYRRAPPNDSELALEEMWEKVCRLRGDADVAEYKHDVLGLIFLKYISDVFERVHRQLANDTESNPEERSEYAARGAFWIPREARWDHIVGNSKNSEIGALIGHAMHSIQTENKLLVGVTKMNYAHRDLNKQRLWGLIDVIGTIIHGDRREYQGFGFDIGKWAQQNES